MFVGIFIGFKPSEDENYYAQRCTIIQLIYFEDINVNSLLLNKFQVNIYFLKAHLHGQNLFVLYFGGRRQMALAL